MCSSDLLPPPALREVFSATAPPPSSASSSTSSLQEPYPPGGPGAGGGMVFSGDKDHRFEYNHSPGQQSNPTSIHLYNHAIGRKDGGPPQPPGPPPGQSWASPSQAVAQPLPLGFVPHVNSAAIRGRGLPF